MPSQQSIGVENRPRLPHRHRHDRVFSKENTEAKISNAYGYSESDFNRRGLDSDSMDNRVYEENPRNEYDHRPVFNYQNPDFGIRRKHIENSLPGTSHSNTDIDYYPRNAQSESIEMNDILKYKPVTDNYDDLQSQCSFPDKSELVHRHHRTTSIHRNATIKTIHSTENRMFSRSLEERRHWMAHAGHKKRKSVVEVEEHANNIAKRMQQDGMLMEDNPESELLRREALRDMPQCLTVKRIIKKKLKSTVSQRSKYKPLSCNKRLKYYLSIKLTQMRNSCKSLINSFELWYSSLKQIEGHFGSGVATYFKFLRWLFLINCSITLCVIGFVVLPQLLYVHVQSVPSVINTTLPNLVITNISFSVQNIFDGEGYFTNTVLYYGFYTTKDIVLISNYAYRMPYAYFLTMICLYFISFCVLSTSMAKSYRQSFIETQGGLKNIYAYKVFCGWDYSIATAEAAELKSSSIYHELKELISDAEKPKKTSFCKLLVSYIIQIIINIFIIMLLIGIGYIMWFLLEEHSIKNNTKESSSHIAIISAILINIIMIIFPTVFGAVVRYEDYKHPRAALYITLIRTFLLKSVVVGVFLAFWLTHSNTEECWETSIGQHIYRLLLFDFIFSLVLGMIIHVTRYIIYKKWSKKFGVPEFDIAHHTLQLLYNQTLFWVGFYFSPLLSVIVVIKLWFTWYLRRTLVLHICKPSSKSWRAAQTQTLFLILSFLSLLLVIITHGYIIVGVKTSNCGPLKEYIYMYEMIIIDIFKLEQGSKFWMVMSYLRKPGAVALIFVGMSVAVYYLRGKAKAQKEMVQILRDMLVLEAKDKEFLIDYISRVTDGRWQYNMKNRTAEVWNTFENAAEFTAEVKRPKHNEESGDSGTSSGSSIVLLK